MITTAEYIRSSVDLKDLPPPNIPEYAFIGRSNVGKSSLINMLCNQNGLAKTSRTPGKTQCINHFLINNTWFIVDLPGYGYAKLPKTKRAQIENMIEEYLTKRPSLMNLFLLIDSRHNPLSIDIDFINQLAIWELPFTLIFTKTDKLKPKELKTNIQLYKETLAEQWETLPPIVLTSALDRIGEKEIHNQLAEMNDIWTKNATKT